MLAPGKGNGIGAPAGGNWKLGGSPPGKGMFGGGGALVEENGGKGGTWPPGGGGPAKFGGPGKLAGGIMPGPPGGNGGTMPVSFRKYPL